MSNDKIENETIESKLILITGATKSGKSEFAEYLAKKVNKLTYIALSENRKEDKDWQKKILIHRNRRPKHWKVVETIDLINILKEEIGDILIDSIGGFVLESINKNNMEWNEKINILISLLKERKNNTFIVGEQVGWGLVSEYKIGNKFIERLGDLQKKITKISHENWLTVNGKAIRLDKISFDIPS